MLDLTDKLAEFPVLETERLRLRQPEMNDTDAYFRMLADPRVVRFLGRPPFTSTDEAAKRLQFFSEEFKARSGLAWIVTRRTAGQFMGVCRYTHFDTFHARAEIGYLMSPDWWGQGLMPEAAKAVIDFGFDRLGLHSIEANIDPDNNQSRRLLEKLGFVQEGYFRESYYIPHEDRFSDSAIFSLLTPARTGQTTAQP